MNTQPIEQIAIRAVILIVLLGCVLIGPGCSDAMVASNNVSKAGDMFEVDRRVVFYNGITGDYMLTIEGKLSIQHAADQLEVTVKTGAEQYRKHFLGLSDNVTYFCEHLSSTKVDAYHYRVLFKPAAIVPDIDLITKAESE